MRGQRGEGKLGLLFWLLFFGAGLYFAVQTIPVKIAVYEFNDFLEKETRFHVTRSSGQFSPAALQKAILEKAEELEIPLDKKQITIKRRGKKVHTDVNYSVTVDLSVYEWVWRYQQHYENYRM